MEYGSPTSPWAFGPVLVSNPGPVHFRYTVTIRPVKKFTVKHQYSMPTLEHELTKLSCSRYFATFDLSHGYWQMDLDAESEEIQSFISRDGICTATRVLHGTKNAVTHRRSSVSEAISIDIQESTLH